MPTQASVDLRNPFPGLRPYKEEEHELFFGQDEHKEQLIDSLSTNRFVAVLGLSGSGKSSLVKAGLMAHLRGKRLSNGGPRWLITTCRPGEDPIGKLAEGLEKNFPGTTAGALREDPKALARLVESAELIPNQRLLIVVDQFEELFRYRRAAKEAQREDESAAFVKLLLAAVNSEAIPVYVVITMRSEFLGDCAAFYDLAEKVNEGTFLLPKLSRDQGEEVIAGPVELRGASIEAALVQRLLNETEEQEDGLPLLQHALRRIWDAWLRRQLPSDPLRMIDFELSDPQPKEGVALVKHHLDRHLEDIYASLGERKVIAKRMFRLLSERDGKGRETRCPVKFEELVAGTGTQAELQKVIDAFRDEQQGRSFLMPPGDEALPGSTVDISHECLLRRWERLTKWIGFEEEDARMYKDLASLTDKADARGDARRPIEGFQLDQFLEWAEKAKPSAIWAKRYEGAVDPKLKRPAMAYEPAMAYLKWSREQHTAAEEKKRQDDIRDAEQRADVEKLKAERAVQEKEAAEQREQIAKLGAEQAALEAQKQHQEVELRRHEAENRYTVAALETKRQSQKVIRNWIIIGILALAALALGRLWYYADSRKNDAYRAKSQADHAKRAALDSSLEAQKAKTVAIEAEQRALLERDRALDEKNKADFARNQAIAAKGEAVRARTAAELAATHLRDAQTELRNKNLEVTKALATNQVLLVTKDKLAQGLTTSNEELSKSRRGETRRRVLAEVKAMIADPRPDDLLAALLTLIPDGLPDGTPYDFSKPEVQRLAADGLSAVSDQLLRQVEAGEMQVSSSVALAFDARGGRLLSVRRAAPSVVGLDIWKDKKRRSGGTARIPRLSGSGIRKSLSVVLRDFQMSVLEDAALSEDGKVLAVSSTRGSVAVYAVGDTLQYRHVIRLGREPVQTLSITRDGKYVLASLKTGWKLIDTERAKEISQGKDKEISIKTSAISPSGDWIAYSTASQVCTQGSAKLVRNRPDPACFGFQPGDGRIPLDISDQGLMSYGGQDKKIYLTAPAKRTALPEDGVRVARFSPGQFRIAVASSQAHIHVFTVGDKPSKWLDLKDSGDQNRTVDQIVWSADGNYLAARYDNGLVRIWQVDGDAKVQAIRDLANRLSSREESKQPLSAREFKGFLTEAQGLTASATRN